MRQFDSILKKESVFIPNNYAAVQGSVVDPELQGETFIW
jgi:hypothetical protein